jgi:hypothetical protein
VILSAPVRSCWCRDELTGLPGPNAEPSSDPTNILHGSASHVPASGCAPVLATKPVAFTVTFGASRVVEGWMTKQGGGTRKIFGRKSWKRRYFSLDVGMSRCMGGCFPWTQCPFISEWLPFRLGHAGIQGRPMLDKSPGRAIAFGLHHHRVLQYPVRDLALIDRLPAPSTPPLLLWTHSHQYDYRNTNTPVKQQALCCLSTGHLRKRTV